MKAEEQPLLSSALAVMNAQLGLKCRKVVLSYYKCCHQTSPFGHF